jgi:hypothetical protein
MSFAGASVTLYAILKVPNALLLVLGLHPVRLMFVAAITRVATEVVVDVTCRTGRIVVAVQDKELQVVECGGLPAFRLVALPATHTEIAVEIILWRRVAGRAAFARRNAQQ